MMRVLKTCICALIFSLVCGMALAAPVKIGLMAPLTGAFASEGQDMRKLVELLAEEVNKAGGINGNPVELIVEDDGSDPRQAANAAQRLIAKEVFASIGTYGSAITEASQSIYDEAGVIQVTTGSTATRLTEKGLKLFFRTCPRDDEQGRVAAGAVEKLGFKRLAILHDNSAYAKSLAEEAKALIDENKDIEIIFYDALVPNERDYTAILTKLKGTNPDGILFTGYYPEAGMLLRQMKEMKWTVPMVGGDATNNLDLVKIAGKDAAEGYYFVSPPLPSDLDSPKTQAFLKAYVEKHKEEPSSIWSVIAGDAFNVLVEAVKNVGTDPEKVAEYLRKDIKDFEGLTGKISFDDKGDRVGDLYRLYKVNAEGKFVLQP